MNKTGYTAIVGCEFSGRVRRALRAIGVNAVSVDLLPSEDNSKHHIQADITEFFDMDWALGIFHPPCTYLCNSGVRWLHTDASRWAKMEDAAEFFRWILDLPIPHIAIENPVMHKYARAIVGRGPDFTVQPWQFGDNEKKRTCFWTKNLSPLRPTSALDGSTAHAAVHLASPGPDRWKVRSVTPQGLADAMADQWGAYAALAGAA